jgi:WD40 repeat protein
VGRRGFTWSQHYWCPAAEGTVVEQYTYKGNLERWFPLPYYIRDHQLFTLGHDHDAVRGQRRSIYILYPISTLKLLQKKLFSRSDRVKGVDFHPTGPWLLAGLYNGTVNIYNHETGAVVTMFEVAEIPVRCGKFIARKNSLIAGSDDFHLRVFNYNNHEKVASFEAHPDYIRCLTVHPTASIVLTGSDDMTIKAWDWDKGWKNIQTYEGHTHYIMNLAFNPKDVNTFVSACLDR